MRMIWAGLAAAILLPGCKRAESELRDKAELLCRYNQLDSILVAAFPAKVVPGNYIRAEDLEQETKNLSEGGALAQAMMLNLGPALQAVSEGYARHTQCEVLSVQVTGEAAEVKVKQIRPDLNLGSASLGKMGDLVKLDTDAARTARVEEWLKQASGSVTSEHVLHFNKSGDVWRANYQLPEHAAVAAKAKDLAAEAALLVENFELADAKAKLQEAIRLVPDDKSLKDELGVVELRMKNLIAGKWSLEQNQDAMTDDVNVVAYLPSETELQKSYGKSRPMLYLRCKEKKFEVYVTLGATVDGSLSDGVTARYRFAGDKAETVELSEAKGGEAVFFPQPDQWLNKLLVNGARNFILEVPIYNGSGVATFELVGISKAVEKVKGNCGK